MSIRVRTSTRGIAGTKLALTDAVEPVVELGADVVFLRQRVYRVSRTIIRLRPLDPVWALLDYLPTEGLGLHPTAQLVTRFDDEEVVDPFVM